MAALRFEVPSLPDAMALLAERGAEFVARHRAFNEGTIAVTADPDGNRIELKQR